MMTIKELKEKLNEYDENLEVCIGLDINEEIKIDYLHKGNRINEGEIANRNIVSLW